MPGFGYTAVMTLPARLTNFDLFLFDIDGTLLLGDAPLAGAVELLAALRAAHKPVYFVTNNTLHPASEHAHRLNNAGIAASVYDVLNPLPGLLDYVADKGIYNPFVIASEEVKAALPHLPHSYDAIILGLCQNWDAAQLQKACNLAATGLPLILCQPDPYCPDPDGNIPDSGALLALMETTLCRTLDHVVIGKPSPHIVSPVLRRHDVAPSRAIMFGDRLKTDMAMADAAGMQGALVLTGQTKRHDVTDTMPYLVLDNLLDLF